MKLLKHSRRGGTARAGLVMAAALWMSTPAVAAATSSPVPASARQQGDHHHHHHHHQHQHAGSGQQDAAAADEHPHSSGAGQDNPTHMHAGHVAAPTAERLYPGFSADQPTPSEQAHVPPPPPASELPPIGMREMIQMMGMDDAARHGMLLVDQLEWRDVDPGATMFWDARFWYGGDYHKLVINTDGSRRGGDQEGSLEVLWDRVLSRWWNVQAGIAHDFGQPRGRTWVTAAIHGFSPYWFDVSARLYLGEQGRSALRLEAGYELLFTQRLILQTHLDLTAYGKQDRVNSLGAGLASGDAGLRLRYEFQREIAPYVGVTRHWRFGDTARLAQPHAASAEWQWLAGLRFWF